MSKRYGWANEYRRDDLPKLPENRVSAPDTNEPDRVRSASEVRRTVGQVADQTNSYGIVVDGIKPSAWSRWLNFSDSASAFLKHEKISLNWDGTATFSGVTGGSLLIESADGTDLANISPTVVQLQNDTETAGISLAGTRPIGWTSYVDLVTPAILLSPQTSVADSLLISGTTAGANASALRAIIGGSGANLYGASLQVSGTAVTSYGLYAENVSSSGTRYAIYTPVGSENAVYHGAAVTIDGLLTAAAGTFSGLITANLGATIASGQTLTLTGATVAGTPTWSSSQAITLSTAAQPNITSVGTLTSLTVSGLVTASGGLASGTQVMSAGMLKLGIATGNAGAALQFLGWAGVNKNWQISNAYVGGDVLDFTPSTLAGGSIFSTSVMTLSPAGALVLSAGLTATTGNFSGLLTASAGINVPTGQAYKFNGTQVVSAQGAAVADATDAASAITQLNALLARVRTHGLIAT